MNEFLPTVALLCVAAAGYLVTFKIELQSLRGIKVSRILSAIGGFSTGLLIVWFAFSLIRFLLLASWLSTSSFASLLLTPVSLFYAESIALLVFSAYECFSLNGYIGPREWHRSCSEAIGLATKFLTITTALFFAAWWMVSPAEYGTFDGSFVSGLVGSTASTSFAPADLVTATTKEEIAAIENAKAIPHATALSVVFAAIGFVVWLAIQYMTKVLNEEYLMPDNDVAPQATVTFSKFEIRGGGPN